MYTAHEKQVLVRLVVDSFAYCLGHSILFYRLLVAGLEGGWGVGVGGGGEGEL